MLIIIKVYKMEFLLFLEAFILSLAVGKTNSQRQNKPMVKVTTK